MQLEEKNNYKASLEIRMNFGMGQPGQVTPKTVKNGTHFFPEWHSALRVRMGSEFTISDSRVSVTLLLTAPGDG